MLASVEVAVTRGERARGLLGRDGIDGAMALPKTRAVHTFGMRFPIDVAHLDGEGLVLRTKTMARHRPGRPVRGAASVLEAAAGAFDAWGLEPGCVVEIEVGHD